jgi:hypothetical protein
MALGTQDNSSITCKRSEYHNLRRAQPPDMSVPITALQFFQHKTSCLLGTQLLRASRYTQDNSSISCRVTQSAMSTTTACHDIQSSSSVSPKRPACHNLANRLLRLQQTSITPTTRFNTLRVPSARTSSRTNRRVTNNRLLGSREVHCGDGRKESRQDSKEC